MHIEQPQMFRGLSEDFIKAVMAVAVKETYKKGTLVFREADPAENDYFLIRGHVRLSIGESGRVVFAVNKPGEAFGWSSLVGRAKHVGFFNSHSPAINVSGGRISEKRAESIRGPRDRYFRSAQNVTGHNTLFKFCIDAGSTRFARANPGIPQCGILRLTSSFRFCMLVIIATL